MGKWLVLVALVSCSSKTDDAPRPPAPATAKVIPAAAAVIPVDAFVPDAPPDAAPTAAEKRAAIAEKRAAEKAAAKVKRQEEIVEAINVALRGGGTSATATSDENDLLLVDHQGSCDRNTLVQLRKGMAAMGFDPADAFDTMQCPSDSVVLKLR